MMELRTTALLWWLTFCIGLNSALLPELECPEDCDCHYFRINWVTDCSENGLTSIPTVDEGLSLNVYMLNMNGNNLTSVQTFPEDIKLRSLTIADNQLTKITSEDFAGLGYLLDIDLSGNSITEIDPEAFADSPGLITVELQMNPLESETGPFLISKSILNLDLSYCNFSRLGPLFFSETPSLNSLDLSGNPLIELVSGTFSPLVNLHELKLNRCNLTSISYEVFSRLQDLKKLELAGNSFTSPMDWASLLGPLKRLEYLDLSRSGVSNLPDDLFEGNRWLRILILAENELRNLDVATTLGQNLKHLDYLDLTNCKISGPLSEGAFANATKLRTLILTGNSMSAADLAVALSPLTKLQKLSLRNCSLSRLPPNIFHKFPDLKELDISRNPLNNAFTSLLNPLKNLLHLDMGYSNLGSISRTTFLKMTSLKTLILSGNPLTSLESGLFQNLTDLEVLELKNCGLSRLDDLVFHESFSYPDLEELRLSGNPLKIPQQGSFLPRQLTRLKTLDLSNCSITSIPPNALYSFGNITTLILKGNNLHFNGGSEFDFLHSLSDLEKLDLSFNNLTVINPYVFRYNPRLNWLKFSGNPWTCGCHISDMWEWAQTVKGDLGVLVGSTVSSEEIIRTNPKRRNTLICHFDRKKSPVKEMMRRKEVANNVNRTWSRYVRESACDSSRRLHPAQLLSPPKPEAFKREIISNNVMSTWGWSVALATIVLVTMATLFIASFRNNSGRKFTPNYTATSHKLIPLNN